MDKLTMGSNKEVTVEDETAVEMPTEEGAAGKTVEDNTECGSENERIIEQIIQCVEDGKDTIDVVITDAGESGLQRAMNYLKRYRKFPYYITNEGKTIDNEFVYNTLVEKFVQDRLPDALKQSFQINEEDDDEETKKEKEKKEKDIKDNTAKILLEVSTQLSKEAKAVTEWLNGLVKEIIINDKEFGLTSDKRAGIAESSKMVGEFWARTQFPSDISPYRICVRITKDGLSVALTIWNSANKKYKGKTYKKIIDKSNELQKSANKDRFFGSAQYDLNASNGIDIEYNDSMGLIPITIFYNFEKDNHVLKSGTNEIIIEKIKEGVKELISHYEDIADYNYVGGRIEDNISMGFRQVVLTGAPGTGKTYGAQKYAEKWNVDPEGNDYPKEKKHYETIQFHPSYDYTDFVEGIRPIQGEDEKKMDFVKLDGEFKRFCRRVVEYGLERLERITNVIYDNKTIIEELEKKGDNKDVKISIDNNMYDKKDICSLKKHYDEFYLDILNEIYKKEKKDRNEEEAELCNKLNGIALEDDTKKQVSRIFSSESRRRNSEAACSLYEKYKLENAKELTENEKFWNDNKVDVIKVLIDKGQSDIKGVSELITEVKNKYNKHEIWIKELIRISDKNEDERSDAEKLLLDLFYFYNDTEKEYEELFVFIIDEINRADISKVMGELMYLLEYRGMSKRMFTQYQNLKTYDLKKNTYMDFDCFEDGFFIPENIIIIGTMNDIDKSVDSFDFAMRRRFGWAEIEVDRPLLTETLKTMLCKDLKGDAKKTKVEEIETLAGCIVEMNEVLTSEKYKKAGLTKAYYIGPAVFKSYTFTKDSRNSIFKNSIAPLLREYVRGRKLSDKVVEWFIKDCRDALKSSDDDNNKQAPSAESEVAVNFEGAGGN